MAYYVEDEPSGAPMMPTGPPYKEVASILPAFGEEGKIDERSLGTWRHVLTQSISVIIRGAPGSLDITVARFVWPLDGSTLRVTYVARMCMTTHLTQLTSI